MIRLSKGQPWPFPILVDRLLMPLAGLQAVQVPANGLRDGYLGDDVFVDCAEEGLQINLLPCELMPASCSIARIRLC